MFNIKSISLIICIFLITAITCLIQPKLPNPVVFENENFELNQEAPNTPNDEVIATVPPAEEIEEQPIQKEQPKQVKKFVKTITPKQEPPKIIQKTQPRQQTIKQTPAVNTKPTQPTTQKINTTPKPVIKQTEIKVEPKPQPQQAKVETPKVQPAAKPAETEEEKKKREEQEEIIAWNKWRSDLQNKVMKDSRLSAPLGTVFRFSCTVDKFGNITNIKTWSDTSSYTPLATRVVKPVLASYQNQPILTFPSKSKRVTTNVVGAFKISTTSRYSTPDQYSDYERIKR